MILKFKPILKSTIWGGEKIVKLKKMESPQPLVGESWEISGIPGSESIVSEGDYEGLPLNQLVHKMGAKLLGTRNHQRFRNEFPLLVKFIDANEDLSIQVHPDEETAQRQGKGHGKTEMWYAMQSSPDAHLYNGLRQVITPEQCKAMANDGTICDALARYEVREGDVFFVPAGCIHSIGKGCLVVEIQQTSDVTYRLYDFMRRGKNGKLRELHLKEAAESIHYQSILDNHITYTPQKNKGIGLVRSPFFTTSIYDLDETMIIDYNNLDSFVILIGLKGQGSLFDHEGRSTSLCEGETVLIPACTKEIKVEGEVKFLETYV